MTKLKTFTLLASAVLLLCGQNGFSDDAPKSSGASGGFAKKMQWDVLGGFDASTESNFQSSWEHQTAKSPVAQIGFHWNFFYQRPVNLILGAQVGFFKSVEEMSGTSTATATTTGW